MLTTVMICLVLLSQIWFLSYYYPNQVVHRIDFVLSHCPENEYPKLYPISTERIKTIKLGYQYLNYLIAFLGIVLFLYFTLVITDHENYLNILDDIPLLFGILQFIPLFLLELLGYKHLKLMREQNTQTNRKAELLPRRLFQFISPIYVYTAFAVYFSYIFFELYVSDFTFTFDTIIKIASVSLANILFIGLALTNLYGKKRDPYISNNERNKQTKFVLHSLTFISIFASIYLMVHSWVNIYGYNFAEILINSLYFQVIALFSVSALLGRFKVEEMNFDVYKHNSN